MASRKKARGPKSGAERIADVAVPYVLAESTRIAIEKMATEAAEEVYKEASEAYTVLTDPDKRAKYDRFGHSGGFEGFGGAGFSGVNLNDIFGEIFGEFFGGRGARVGSRARGTDLRYNLEL